MILRCVTLTQRCSRTKEAFEERGHYFNMVRNYKKKTDKVYAWKTPRVRTWDVKQPKVDVPKEEEDWNEGPWLAPEEGYPVEDHYMETVAILAHYRKLNH